MTDQLIQTEELKVIVNEENKQGSLGRDSLGGIPKSLSVLSIPGLKKEI